MCFELVSLAEYSCQHQVEISRHWVLALSYRHYYTLTYPADRLTATVGNVHLASFMAEKTITALLRDAYKCKFFFSSSAHQLTDARI